MGMDYREMAPPVTAVDADDPNTSDPLANDPLRVYTVETVTRDGKQPSTGAIFYFVFTAGTAPTATVEVWIHDDKNARWVLVTTTSATAENIPISVADIGTSKVYLRYTAITGTPTDVRARVATL